MVVHKEILSINEILKDKAVLYSLFKQCGTLKVHRLFYKKNGGVYDVGETRQGLISREARIRLNL
jgi:hypothetical protein